MLTSLFRRFSMTFAMAAMGILVVALMAMANPAAAAAHAYTFTTLNNNNDPTFNQLLGINNHGVIAGYFGSGVPATVHPNKGYTLSAPYGQGNYKNENFPGSVQTQVIAINNHGNTAGFWADANNNNFGFIEWNGVFTSYSDPNTPAGATTVNQLLGLNDNGIAVGFYTDANGNNHAYELNQKNGKFTELLPTNAVSAIATGINDNGDVTGFLTTSTGATVGFLKKGSSYTEFSFPNGSNTQALGINKYDQIVGSYADANGNTHGFLLSSPLHHAKFQTIDDPNGIGTTVVNGINDKGNLVGFYVDGAGNTDGFLAK